jgi:hypothetical protein
VCGIISSSQRDGAGIWGRWNANGPGTARLFYELGLGQIALRMGVASGAPAGPSTTEYQKTLRLEQNRLYQAALLEATDPWLWDLVVSPATKSFPFTVGALASSGTSSKIVVVIQGASDYLEMDHHVVVSVNGTAVAENDFLDDAYFTPAIDAVKVQLKKAGVRLAALIEAAQEEWVKAHFNDAAAKPPPGALTTQQVAEQTGFSRSTAEKMLRDKVSKGELAEVEFLVKGHWTKFYMPKDQGKPKKKR